jgi:hypothetical protein
MGDGWGPAVTAVREARLERERVRDQELADYFASEEFAAVTTYALGRLLTWLGEARLRGLLPH